MIRLGRWRPTERPPIHGGMSGNEGERRPRPPCGAVHTCWPDQPADKSQRGRTTRTSFSSSSPGMHRAALSRMVATVARQPSNEATFSGCSGQSWGGSEAASRSPAPSQPPSNQSRTARGGSGRHRRGSIGETVGGRSGNGVVAACGCHLSATLPDWPAWHP